MKDPVQEFEALNEAIGNIFNRIGNVVNKKLGVSNKGANTAYITPKSAQQNITAHAQGIETGSECPVGTAPNGKFFSEVGSPHAQFGERGYVKNIVPFLNSLNISKRDLRCYDLKKDKLKIKWLFDGDYEADTIWFKKRKIYFQGKWNNGAFEGVFVPTTDIHPLSGPPTIEFYILVDGKQTGPYTNEKIPTLVKYNLLNANSLIWKSGLKNWIQAKNDAQLSVMLNPAITPPVKPGQKTTATTKRPAIRKSL